ncbi:MAG TPA: hypothetical protein VF932_01015 [Anaerolineae bacterium]
MKLVFRSSQALLACFSIILFILISFTPAGLHAQTPTAIPIPVALAPVQRDTPVELVAVTVDADIGESSGHTLVTGNSTFKLHNTDNLNDVQVAVGFPAWAGDPFTFDPSKLNTFSVSVEGKKAILSPSRADLKVGSAVRTVDWYTFTLPLAADEKKTVRLDFQQDLGDSALPRFAYGLRTATGWKGSIGSARITLRFPESTLPEQIADYDPPNPKFDGASFSWNFTNHEPPTNPTLTFLRPSVWNDLLTRRHAVQQNPNDANAHSSLGGIFRQLSSVDSTRRDSYYAQAIAELETAVRLDPNQRSARQMLGALYESRAGPPAGPRQTNYVLLAVAQWETLASTDASARKQLAEDYFYLGLDAQTRGAFPDALSYFDKAASLAPGGVGPLFTTDRAAAQRRSLNIAWARAYLDKDNFPSASEKARLALGDAFVKSFYPPPFYVTFAGVTMSSNSREMVFRLVPFASKSAELQNALNGIIEPLRGMGVDSGIAQVPDSSDLELHITVQFTKQSDLDQKLAAVAQSIPDSPEWSLVHTVLSPQALTWSAPGGWITNSNSYQEQVDLSPACGILEKQLGTIAQALKPLESAPATDTEAQLKQALLKNAQSGWQRALAQGRVRYRAGSNETNVDACAARTVAFSSSPLRVEFIVVLAVLSGGLLGLGILYLEWKRKRTRRNKLRHATDKPL